MNKIYKGVFPIAPTPFKDDGAIEAESQKRVLDCMIDQGVDDLREYKTRWGEAIPIENASFGQILRDDERFSDAVGGVHKIRGLVSFRNELVHKVVAERSHLDLGEMGRALDAKANLERLIST